MIGYNGLTADGLYRMALADLAHYSQDQESRIEATKELMHVMFTLQEPRNRLVSIRDINPAFAFVEVLWIAAGGNNVKYLEFWNPRMKQFAQVNGLLYGAYGARLGFQHFWDNADEFNAPHEFSADLRAVLYLHGPACDFNQLNYAHQALKGKPNSRQVVLQVYNPAYDLPTQFGAERAKDVPCNLMSHLLLRDNQLHWLQVMRSNDAIWGWPYNIIQWTFIQEMMAGWLGCDLGDFVLLSDSFHVYEKHWSNIDRILNRAFASKPYPTYSLDFRLPLTQWKKSYRAMIITADLLTRCAIGKEQELIDDCIGYGGCNSVFKPLLGMLAAEAARIKGHPDLTSKYMDLIDDSYWLNSYMRWIDAKTSKDII